MSTPMIHGQNLESLQRMLGVPIRMKCVPPEVIERVLKAQKCMSRISLSEALPEHTLLLLCYDFEQVPAPVATKFGHLRDGTQIFFKVNEYEWQPCVFIAVADPQMHTYHIHIWGEFRTAPENMLRETHPADVPDAEIEAPVKTVTKEAAINEVAADQDEAKGDANTEAERDAELDAARALDQVERLKKVWTAGRMVDVAIPGEEFFRGTVLSVGSGRFAGTIIVRPTTEKGTGFRRVPVAAISASELQPA